MRQHTPTIAISGEDHVPPRLKWAVQQLNARPNDRVLEIGCGTGVAASLLCKCLTSGRLTAIDRSAPMIAAARRRNRPCIAEGRAVFRRLALAEADFAPGSFDRALAVNVNVFWLGPAAELTVLSRILRRGGMLCLIYQPPSTSQIPGVARACSRFLRSHGFARVRVTTVELHPGRAVSIGALNHAG